MAAVLEPVGETPPALSFHELPVNNSREAILENIRVNLKRGLPGIKQYEATDIPLIVVGGGPSLHEYLPILRSFRQDCHVLAVNGAYKFLRSVGIESEHFVLIDSRRDNLIHVDSPHEGTHHYLASQVHPAVFDELGEYQVTMFHLATDTGLEGTAHLPDPKSYLAAPIGMASVHAIYLGAALGYRKMFLFGYDMSRKAGQSYAFEQRMNKDDQYFEVEVLGERFETTVPMARTAEQFQKAIGPMVGALGLDIRLFCSGLLPAVIKAASVVNEETERRKYEQMWTLDVYRKTSPGLESVVDAETKLQIPQGASIADFGCGTGRCVKWFRLAGFKSVGVDIAGNCLEVDEPFVQAALWDAEKLPEVDYGFSTDVLEHIPTDRVDDTLKAIHGACRVGCYLNVDTLPDSMGVFIGQTLHMTVQPAEWWEQKLKALWPHVDSYPGERQAIFVCRK